MADEPKTQPARRLDWRWTNTRRNRFLGKLAETYDIEAALKEANLTWPQVCELRVRHPEFAARFEEVIAAGYDRLEAMLLRQAGLGAEAVPDPALAQALIKMRRTARAELASRRGTKGPTRQQLIGSIVDVLAPLRAVQAGGTLNGEKSGRPSGAGPGVGGAGGAGGDS